MLKSKWLNLILDVDFVTLNVLKLEISIYLGFIIHLSASSRKFEENHQFYVVISYFQQILASRFVQYHLLAHHLRCFLRYVNFSWNCFVIINCLAL